MAVWEVSEPHINVWLYDEPLGYQPGLGPRISFKLAYKQRETRDFYKGVSGNYTGVGPGWHCSWVSYLYPDFVIVTNTVAGVTVYTTNFSGTATVVMSDGGQRTFATDGTSPEYYSHGVLTPTIVGDIWVACTIAYPDGSKEDYSVVTSSPLPVVASQILFLTARYDRFGNATRFYYQLASPLLQYVVDADGRTNTLSYSGSRISSVQDPFGRTATLQYDTFGVLTNIADVAGLNSGFIYDLNGWVTNLTTPYGSTRFEHLDNGFEVGSGNVIRAVRVIDAEYGTNVYMLTQCKAWPNGSIPTIAQAIVPNNFDGCMGYYHCRDSMYWGSRQSVNLPLDLNQITSDDGIKARMRHWLHDGGEISQTLSMEIEPSPDGQVSGQTTLFDHEGKPQCYNIGPNSQPSIVARLLPDNTTWFTWYRRDDLGRPTNIVETYSTGFGVTPLLRTNRYTYSGSDLVAHIGPNGNVEDGYTYNTHHQLTYYTNAVGDVTAYTYDAFGRATSTRTAAGLTTTNILFATGGDTNFVQQVIDLEIARTNFFTWTNDLVFTQTDERGLVTTNLYDNLQRLTNTVNSLGKVAYTYNKLDLVRVVDRMGFTNSFGYDKVRRKIAETNALGFYTQYIYCSCGALDSIRDAAGNDTFFYYDNAGRMTNVVYPDGYGVFTIYDLLGERLSSMDTAGINVTNWYNNQGLPYTTWNAAGQVSLVQFDIKDRPLYVTDANGVMITNTYDAASRLCARGYPDGGVERFGYTARGLVAYTNQLNYTNFYVYDEARRKTFETNANAEVIRYTNNAAGDLLSLTDGKNQTTRWKYDQFGRVTNKLDQAGASILVYKYDSNNRLTIRWSAAMGDTRYKYDVVGNLTNMTYAIGTPPVTMRYDALNRLTNMVDAVGTNKYTYSASGQLVTEDGPFDSDTVTNIYWNRLRVNMNLQQPTGVWTNAFGYDPAGRLWDVISPAGEFDYSYQDGSASRLVQKLLLPNTSYITNTYDGNARLLGTWLKNSGNTTLDATTYGYNAGNQRTATTNATGTNVIYKYDRIGQLKVADSSENAEDRGYAYDTAWNLNQRTNNGTLQTFTVDGKNQLTGTPTGTPSYDANGNMTYAPPLDSGYSQSGFTYTFDGENQLSSVESAYTWKQEYVYDGKMRRRVRRDYTFSYPNWVLSQEVQYVYDGMRVIQERYSNSQAESYTRGTDLSGSMEGAGGIGGMLARTESYSGSVISSSYYHADGNGNITALVDSSQSVQGRYRYDAFGNTLSQSGTLADANTYRFSSKEYDGNTGLYYYGYRFYAPNLQRWVNRDPIGETGGIELYEFVGNNPQNKTDALGLVSFFPGAIITFPPLSWRGVAAGIGGALAAGGGLLMSHCPDLTCHKGSCQNCCAGGLAVGTAGVIAGVAVLEGSGWGAWLGVAAAFAGQAALLDGYNVCMTACASKPY